MPVSSPGSDDEKAGAMPLEEALKKNKEATEEVRRAADDLAVVHAVLDTRVTHDSADGDVQRAVDETSRLEKKLGDSADKLDEVNQSLEREARRAP